MIGIIVAMKSEREAIQKLMTDVRPQQYYDLVFHTGKLAGKDVVLAEGGVGKVRSAITCTRMLEHFDCSEMINIGTAGGIKEYENVLDVVVADKATYHDWNNESVNSLESNFANNEKEGLVFYSSPRLVTLAQQVMSSIDEHKTYIGPIVSGDAFVTFEETVQHIQKHFPEAVACDMESASIGHVCSSYGVEYVVIRSLSDIVIKEGNEMDFLTYVEKASDRAAVFTERFVAAL